MVAGGLLALSALLAQAGAQIEAGARIETRVGEVPEPTEQTEVVVLATPSLRLHWFAGVDDFQTEVATRILWRPVPLPRSRPLFLETFGVTHTMRPTIRSQWHLGLRASYGEQDYTSLSQQFATQPTLPLSTTMFMIDGAADTLWRSSRRTTLSLQLGAVHHRTLDTGSSESTAPTLPTQTTVSATPALHFLLSSYSSVEVSAPVSDYEIQEPAGRLPQARQLNVVSVQPQVSGLAQLTRDHQLHLIAGLTYVDVVRGSNANLGYPVAPIAHVNLFSYLHRDHISSVFSSVGAGTLWFLDPVLARGVWRGIAQARLDAQMGLRWSAGAGFTFAADVLNPPAAGMDYDATVVAADSSVRYRWTNVIVAELGGRFTERAPYLSSSEFAWRRRELWAFLTLYTAARMPLSTSRPTKDIIGL